MALTATEALLRRERAIVAVGLAVVAALTWAYVATGGGTGMSVREMTRLAVSPGAFQEPGPTAQVAWTPGYWLIMVLMWWAMMIAMMVPSATPTILLHASVTRHAQRDGRMTAGAVPTAAFAGGYLIVWAGFSLAATGMQFALERAGLVSSMMMWSLDPWLSAGLLLAAGLYELTPLKHACLNQCRSPVDFLSRNWRPGRAGAIAMGIRHGAYCVGCCWALMALLFVGGIMNLLWIAGLAAFVLLEKVAPRGDLLARAGGVACLGAALWIGLTAAGVI